MLKTGSRANNLGKNVSNKPFGQRKAAYWLHPCSQPLRFSLWYNRRTWHPIHPRSEPSAYNGRTCNKQIDQKLRLIFARIFRLLPRCVKFDESYPTGDSILKVGIHQLNNGTDDHSWNSSFFNIFTRFLGLSIGLHALHESLQVFVRARSLVFFYL